MRNASCYFFSRYILGTRKHSFIMQRRRINLPLTLITALLVALIAGLAGSTLVLLRRMHARSTHTAAAETVIRQGQAMVARLSSQPSVTASPDDETDWSEFSRLIRNLHSIEDGLQYVSVTRNDVVVFHEQTRLLDGSPQPDPSPPPTGAVDMRREVLHVGEDVIPVVVFTTGIQGIGDERTSVSVALRKDTVNREEEAAETAMTSMFRLTLLTVVVSFSICVILVVWMMRREVKREALRRDEEHLAFSGMLANGIVHDFRNPMSSMRLDVQMLHRETERGEEARPDRMRSLSERVRNTLDRMDKVFQEFLYVSRPDRDDRTAIDLVTCIEDSLEMLAPRFEQANVTSRVEAPPETVHVLAYEGSLRRALVNVLTNAEQFSPPEETVSVSVSATHDTAIVEVSDRGPGVPKHKRKQVFDMFVTERPEGTGLGLFLAKAAIERSGGTIEIAETTEDRGACVRIRLPLAPSATPNSLSRPSDLASGDAEIESAQTGTETA